MQRQLVILGFVLLVVGLELATEAVSLAGGRLSSGATAITNGLEFHVSGLRYVAGVMAIAAGAGAGAVALWISRARRTVTNQGPVCPVCGGTTNRVKRRKRQRLLSRLLGERLARRRCAACGWEGLSLPS